MKIQVTIPVFLFALIVFSKVTLAQITITSTDASAINAVGLSSGIYFYKLSVSAWPSQDGQAGSFVDTKKMILIR